MIKAFSADLIYTLNGSAIPNGVVEVNEEGVVIHVGENASSSTRQVEKLKGFICPGFVNTHCHLELSHLKSKVKEKQQLHGFIRELQELRIDEEESIQNAIKKADQEMIDNGIVAVGDICNGTDSFSVKSKSRIDYTSFIELFGFDPKKANLILERGLQIKKEADVQYLKSSISPHSPYSVSQDLLKSISSIDSTLPISIHNQETKAENQMFESGEGSLVQLLAKFGLNLSHWKHSGKSSLKSYLHHLPKDRNLLLVHNTFTNKDDIEWAEEKHNHLFWCFCPNANLYIENRLPDIPQFIDHGVKCTLGTDSLASNWQLSIWEEIKIVQRHFPNIKLEVLLEWACINGAEFLGLNQRIGSIDVGKKPGLLNIHKDCIRTLTLI